MKPWSPLGLPIYRSQWVYFFLTCFDLSFCNLHSQAFSWDVVGWVWKDLGEEESGGLRKGRKELPFTLTTPIWAWWYTPEIPALTM
jgi:hypothetical protein